LRFGVPRLLPNFEGPTAALFPHIGHYSPAAKLASYACARWRKSEVWPGRGHYPEILQGSREPCRVATSARPPAQCGASGARLWWLSFPCGLHKGVYCRRRRNRRCATERSMTCVWPWGIPFPQVAMLAAVGAAGATWANLSRGARWFRASATFEAAPARSHRICAEPTRCPRGRRRRRAAPADVKPALGTGKRPRLARYRPKPRLSAAQPARQSIPSPAAARSRDWPVRVLGSPAKMVLKNEKPGTVARALR